MLNRSSTTPLHQQMEEIIRAKLANREWPPQHKIPSESELCAQYGVSRGTIRNVISKLVYEGLFERIPGKGTFVNESKITIPISSAAAYPSIRSQLESSGYEVKNKLISLECTMINHAISRKFNGKPDDLFYVIERRRLVKGLPLISSITYLPCALCPGFETVFDIDAEFIKLLEENYGLRPARVEEALESIPAGRPCAEALSVNIGYPLLMLEDTVYTENDIPYEYSIITFRGDRIRIHVSF